MTNLGQILNHSYTQLHTSIYYFHKMLHRYQLFNGYDETVNFTDVQLAEHCDIHRLGNKGSRFASVHLKIEIHEIREIHLVCEIHLPEYRNPVHAYEIHCLKVEIHEIHVQSSNAKNRNPLEVDMCAKSSCLNVKIHTCWGKFSGLHEN